MAEILNEWRYRRARSGLRSVRTGDEAVELAAPIAGYEALKASGGLSLELTTLADLGLALIKGRIAKGWTQTQLARRLGVAKQQIQRYEATGYAAASLSRILQVTEALDVRFSGHAESGAHGEYRPGPASWLAGQRAADSFRAVERRARLRNLGALEARRTYDDLCATYYRLVGRRRRSERAGREELAHRLAVRQAMRMLAHKPGGP